jgi:hypothetical protein
MNKILALELAIDYLKNKHNNLLPVEIDIELTKFKNIRSGW